MTQPETSTRYIGLCAACGRNHKVRSGALVHHGYTRPGDGVQHGDCFGVDYEPHETSPRLAEELQATARTNRDHLVSVCLGPAPATLEVQGHGYRAPTKTITAADGYRWERALDSHYYGLQMQIKQRESDLAYLGRILKDWAPVALTTVEEDIDRQTAEKKAKRDAKANEKQAKADAKADKAAARAARSDELDAKRLAKAKHAIGDVIGFTLPPRWPNSDNFVVNGKVTALSIDSGEKGREVHYEIEGQCYPSGRAQSFPQSWFKKYKS